MTNKPMFARIRKSKTIKLLMAFTAVNLVTQMAFPTVAMALTAGSASPEFASFEPVATTDMVNDFTGDFTYNLPVLSVPGPDGGGYSMSLSYHSGGSSEEEASWVGHGWTLNPGAINRQKRGYADDFKGVTVEKYNKQYPNWTHVSSFNMNLELNSSDDGDSDDDESDGQDGSGGVKAVSFLGIGLGGDDFDDDGDHDNDGDDDEATIQPSVSFSKSIRYNNYSGFAITSGFGVGVKGMGSVNMNSTGGETTLGVSINPLAILNASRKKKREKNQIERDKAFANKEPNNFQKGLRETGRAAKRAVTPGYYSAWSFNAPAVPYSVAYNAGRAYNYSMSLGIEVFTIGVQFGIQGSMNFQANQPRVTTKVYGYMYNPDKSLYEAIEGKDYDDAKNETTGIVEADYQIEKGSTFNKHDKNLGIPFNNADVFTATGNGVIGGFKFYHNNIGHYYPTFVKNKQKIIQAGIEVAIGQTIAVGLDAGLGFQSTTVQDWRAVEGDDAVHYYDNVPAYMAFNGDMGGTVDYTGDDDLMYATVGGRYMNRKLNIETFSSASGLPNVTSVNTKTRLDTDNDQKTSRVKYFTDSGGELLNRIEVTNKDGNVSIYGKPVYTKNEYELTVGLPSSHPAGVLTDGESLTQGYTVAKSVDLTEPLNEKTVVGESIADPYASTFLLTQNTTFDYVDVNGNGVADAADFGGWTKFAYRNVHSNYQYRAPYTGVIYDQGRMINGHDQSGSMSTGQKEVKYLSKIETKTHVAFFVTNKTTAANFPGYTTLNLNGSGITRTDGVDAEAESGGMPSNPHYLENLERIVLYAKNDLSKPISTTYFKYDYSICKGIPNTTTASNGKLTLKKVWTESGGTIKSKVAPYQFEYNYHIYDEPEILAKYPDINDDFLFSYLPFSNPINQNDPVFKQDQEAAQNPLFQEGLLDPWGSYRLNAADRFHNRQPWVDQYFNLLEEVGIPFDAAAWQLKQIKLPSGGEIHIQYEQKDYRFVQNKEAMAMTNLLDVPGEKNNYRSGKTDNGNPENRYYIDLGSIGFNSNGQSTSAIARIQYKNMLKNYFVNRKNKLYFKMLYSYRGQAIPNLNTHHHDIDYITGYTAVNDVGLDGNKIYFELGELKSNGDGKKDKTLPRYVGYQKFLTSAHRNLGRDARNVDNDDESLLIKAYDNGDTDVKTSEIQNKANSLAKSNTFDLFSDWVNGDIRNESIKNICEEYNFDLSYFKIPMYNPKKGGGIRVKRLLSYDPGISGETGDAMIYGSEYIYKNTDGLSSGVATNEPQTIREENALVGILERNKQSGWDKTFNGRDSKQYEGPLGETLLPGAQVVHERVIIKNIHSGRTTTGYAVNKYHTVKGFPMLTDFSELSKDGDDPTYKKYNLSLPLGLINLSYNKAWVTQGYLFKLNDMNGKLESQATYAGNYSPNTFKEAAYTSKTTYEYSKPGESLATLIYNPASQEFIPGSLKLGQEEDLTMYRSRVRDVTNDFSLELDINFLIQWPPALTLGFGLSYSYTQNELSQHLTSKVIRQKTVLKSTTTTTDGVTQITRNIAFDKNTGDPVLTQTFDGYMDPNDVIYTEQGGNATHNGHYYALNIPASWIYSEMGQQDNVNPNFSNQLTASVGNVVTYGKNTLVDPVTGRLKAGNTNLTSFPFENVINASATVYKKEWFLADYAPTNKLNSHYYPQRTYVYRDEVKNANGIDKIYGGGIISNPFDIFPWTDNNGIAIDYTGTSSNNNSIAGVNNKWYSASEIKKYSENGYPLEEQDVLGIYSAAKFGYSTTLPILVAQNAEKDQVHFIDFESGNNDQDNNQVNDFSIVSYSAHSGRGSFDFSGNNNQVFIDDYNINGNLLAKGVTIKLWLKSTLSNNPSSPNFNIKNPSPNLQALMGNQSYNFKRVAQTGNWSLYTVDIKNFNGLTAGLHDIKLGYNFLLNEEVLIDDFRIQPLDAVMNCTVYTKNNKVAAQFDDQHFGVYYEYNIKEQLVRKSIETERGKKTLQEQQYNTPLINR